MALFQSWLDTDKHEPHHKEHEATSLARTAGLVGLVLAGSIAAGSCHGKSMLLKDGTRARYETIGSASDLTLERSNGLTQETITCRRNGNFVTGTTTYAVLVDNGSNTRLYQRTDKNPEFTRRAYACEQYATQLDSQ